MEAFFQRFASFDADRLDTRAIFTDDDGFLGRLVDDD